MRATAADNLELPGELRDILMDNQTWSSQFRALPAPKVQARPRPKAKPKAKPKTKRLTVDRPRAKACTGNE